MNSRYYLNELGLSNISKRPLCLCNTVFSDNISLIYHSINNRRSINNRKYFNNKLYPGYTYGIPIRYSVFCEEDDSSLEYYSLGKRSLS